MNQIKKLAGQTAYYGISSILGRILNFALVPLYTRQLPEAEYGIVINLYGYVALLNIIYTYGLETAFFRFTTKHRSLEAYHYTATSILFTSLTLSALIFMGAPQIAPFTEAAENPEFIRYLSLILWIDAVVAIPFAKIRLDDRPLKFALIRLSVIVVTIFLNLLFLWIFPAIEAGRYLSGLQGIVGRIYDPDIGVGYIFIANLMANLLYFPMLYKELLVLRIRWSWGAMRPIIAYAFPIFLMGLAGMFNEQGYAVLLPEFFVGDGREALGVFGATFKLSMFMMLGIQAFRYAGEPFFFSHAEDKEAPALFAKIMHYFVIFNLIVMVGIAANRDFLGALFLGKEGFRQALSVLPVLLMAKLFYGVYVNLSVWFKIRDQTIYGTYFASTGALITLIGNVALIPAIGYYGSALTALACYLLMCIGCYIKGRQVFRVPYNFRPLVLYLLMALALIYGGQQIKVGNTWLDYSIGFLITGIFLFIMYRLEGRNFQYKSSNDSR